MCVFFVVVFFRTPLFFFLLLLFFFFFFFIREIKRVFFPSPSLNLIYIDIFPLFASFPLLLIHIYNRFSLQQQHSKHHRTTPPSLILYFPLFFFHFSCSIFITCRPFTCSNFLSFIFFLSIKLSFSVSLSLSLFLLCPLGVRRNTL